MERSSLSRRIFLNAAGGAAFLLAAANFLTCGRSEAEQKHDPPLLYDLNHDPSEKYNIADQHPEILADLERELNKHRKDLVPGENQLIKRIEENP
jgi:hypothetical protein